MFSAERGFSHQYLKYKPYYDKRRQASPYKYLNAGNVIGYAGAIRKLYKPGRLFSIKVALTRQHHIRRVLHLCSYIYARIRSKITGKKVSNFFFPWYYYSDQAIMAKRFARNFRQLSIDLDRSSKLFWCTAFEWKDIEHHYRLVDGKLQNLHTGHIPACIHVPDSANYEYVFLRLFELVHRS